MVLKVEDSRMGLQIQFQEQQKRYTVALENNKTLKRKVSNLPQLEKEAENLQNEKHVTLRK